MFVGCLLSFLVFFVLRFQVTADMPSIATGPRSAVMGSCSM